jgi:hypothetical protein
MAWTSGRWCSRSVGSWLVRGCHSPPPAWHGGVSDDVSLGLGVVDRESCASFHVANERCTELRGVRQVRIVGRTVHEGGEPESLFREDGHTPVVIEHRGIPAQLGGEVSGPTKHLDPPASHVIAMFLGDAAGREGTQGFDGQKVRRS